MSESNLLTLRVICLETPRDSFYHFCTQENKTLGLNMLKCDEKAILEIINIKFLSQSLTKHISGLE